MTNKNTMPYMNCKNVRFSWMGPFEPKRCIKNPALKLQMGTVISDCKHAEENKGEH